ncbi:MAG: hypothetical protein Q4G09_07020 [Clostridia bacterium]|nr:hypothetical protein [Clostridia bacterium]
MRKISFEEWIEKFLKENKINKLDTFEVETNGKKHIFTVNNIIDVIKVTNEQEQNEIIKMFEKIVNVKGSIKDYMMCLSVAFINAYEQSNIEENEETI